MVDSIYVFGMLTLQLGVASFCANQLFLRQRHQRVYVPLALFFAAMAINGIIGIVGTLWSHQENERILVLWSSLSFPISMTQPLLFWLYVRALTSEDEASPVTHKIWHTLPLVLSVVLVLLMFMLPRSLFEQHTLERDSLSSMTIFTLIYIQVMELIYYAQIGIYLFLTMRMLSTYRARLKDLFATTENRELSWVWWITTVVSAYLLLSIAEIVANLIGIEFTASYLEASELMDEIVSLAITWVIGIWGLRQQPGMMRNMASDEHATDRTEMSAAKYERSALTDDHATRIAGKIEKAMAKDMLYRDANLSLWDLAKHISVTSNYVSQTLNMTLHSNFFDYVNKWRIQDAVKQLHDTEETILVIAYDVGFNSRSSFYNAFKREMGTTPSALRAINPNGAVPVAD